MDDVLLQQDGVRPHTIAATTDAIAHLGFTVLPHPACSPDLAPSDFHLFPNLKEDPRDQNLSSDAQVKAAICQWFQEKESYSFKGGIQKNVKHWEKSIKVGGDYVE